MLSHLAEIEGMQHVNNTDEMKKETIDTPRRITVYNKRLISKCKKSEKKYAYLPWHY